MLIGFLIALVGLQAIGVDRIKAMVGLSPSPQVADNNASAAPDADEPFISIPTLEDTARNLVQVNLVQSEDNMPCATFTNNKQKLFNYLIGEVVVLIKQNLINILCLVKACSAAQILMF